VWFDDISAVVAVGFESGEDFGQAALAFARQCVTLGFVAALDGVEAVFNVNVGDMCFDGLVEFQRVLPRVGRWTAVTWLRPLW
jgi:hypothetical protein